MTILNALAVIILLSASQQGSVAYRRDHRFLQSHGTQPSPAYAALLKTYGKSFGSIVEHLNSDGTKTRKIVLNNNATMPLIGFGTFLLEGNSTEKKKTVKQAIAAGYKLIDTAFLYDTEEEIGSVLAESFASGKLKRGDIFVTTKVWPTYFTKSRVLQSIRSSLKKLKLDYIDLVLLHYPTGFKSGSNKFPEYANGSIIPLTWRKDAYLETWEAMEDAAQSGLTRSIGVSNFNTSQMRKLLRKAKVKPVVNQVESHPFLNQEKLRQYLLANEVVMQAYAPLRRADKELLENPVLKQIGRRHRKSAAQVALRWQLDRPAVALVVKSSNPTRMAANLDLFDFALSPNETATVLAIEQRPRIYSIPGIESHPDYPFGKE